MTKIYTIFFIFLIFIQVSFSQNLITDPSFDEPIESEYNLNTPCSFYTDSTFNSSSKTWWTENGSPDIITKKLNTCPNHMDQLYSKCLGLCFSRYKDYNILSNYETVSTKLIRIIPKHSKCKIKLDLFFNSNLHHQTINFNSKIVNHINIALKNSLDSLVIDTIRVPIHINSYKYWTTIEYSFITTNDFDIIQFLYIADENEKQNERQQSYIYAYMDNFYLSSNFVDKDLSINNTTDRRILSYYFDTNQDKLKLSQQNQLLEDIDSLNPLYIDSIIIIGHADSRHTFEYNKNLSRQRAENVSNFINKRSKLHVKTKAIGQGIDDKNLNSKARRVDIITYFSKKEIAPWYRTANNKNSIINRSFYTSQEEIKLAEQLPSKKRIPKEQILDNKAYDAYKLILAKAKSAKILIINEAHYLPQNREYISSLLKGLMSIGYNHLAVEALDSNRDLNSLTIKDPLFYRYLLYAESINYNLVSYDNKTYVEPDWKTVMTKFDMSDVVIKGGFESINQSMNIRDYNQFTVLKQTIDKLKANEKIIIHVGHGHGGIVQNGFWKPMGAYLKQEYGNNSVLAIDQISMNECSVIDSNEYVNHYKPTFSIVPSQNNKPFIEKQYDPLTDSYIEMYDLQIIHPQKEIPNLRYKEEYISHTNKKYDYPILILIYKEKDNPFTDIAFSIVHINNSQERKKSIVPYEKYKIFIKDQNNKVSKKWY